jgi:hypothetical protein
MVDAEIYGSYTKVQEGWAVRVPWSPSTAQGSYKQLDRDLLEMHWVSVKTKAGALHSVLIKKVLFFSNGFAVCSFVKMP